MVLGQFLQAPWAQVFLFCFVCFIGFLVGLQVFLSPPPSFIRLPALWPKFCCESQHLLQSSVGWSLSEVLYDTPFKCWEVYHTGPILKNKFTQLKIQLEKQQQKKDDAVWARLSSVSALWEHLEQGVLRLQSWQRISLRWLLTLIHCCVCVDGRTHSEPQSRHSEVHGKKRNGLCLSMM